MKVAFSSTGAALDSNIDPRFGRAGLFLIIDTSTQKMTVVNNDQNAQAMQGAGIQAAKTVADSGAEALITGHCGPKAFQTLLAAGISVYVGVEGTVEQALAKYEAGELKATNAPDVQGHW